MSPSWLRRTRAEVDSGAIRDNVAALAAVVSPSRVMIAVKADGYGHGALTAARAAVEGGAHWLGVATVDEGAQLRAGGLEVPVLVLSRAFGAALDAAVAADLHLSVDGDEAVDDLEAATSRVGRRAGAHLVIDTGMHRIGVSPDAAAGVARRLQSSTWLDLVGTATHFARADDTEDGTTAVQLARFDSALAGIRAAGVDPGLLHAANSAGSLAHPEARLDMVRIGIAAYGVHPFRDGTSPVPLRPAMRLVSHVSAIRRIGDGEGVSYGHHHRSVGDEWIATVPIGYADGVRRDSGIRGVDVLIRGRRRPIRGAVTMDQAMVGVDESVEIGDEVVLLGKQGDETVSASEVAGRLETIPYEVLTSVGSRVPRVRS